MFSRSRAPTRLAIVVIVAGLVAAPLAGTAAGHSQAGAVQTKAPAHIGLGLSPSLMKSARWITLKDGTKVYGVPMTIKVSGGKLLAHPASFGNNPYATARVNYGSGMCMSSYPNTQGSGVDQFAYNNSANQEWIYATYTDNEPYLFAYNANNLCLNNFGFSFSNGNQMALWSCSSSSIAMWFGAGASNYGGYELIHLFQSFGAWSHQCVTTLPGRPSGSAVEEWTCDKTSVWQAFSGLWDPPSPPG
jgi:hypothetical protein